MRDIVERLKRVGSERQRTTAHDNPKHYLHIVAKISNADGLLMQEAADEITRLRAALREIDEIGRVAAQVPGPRNKLMEICARARAAMEVEMSDTLRERVARALKDHPLVPFTDDAALTLADAAIALVLEEAAKVVTEHYQELCTEHRLLLVSRAAAIRALKENDDA